MQSTHHDAHVPRRCGTPAAAPACQPLWRAQRQRHASASTRSRVSAVTCRAAQLQLLLYTKPECLLCDGLKDKLQALIDRASFMPSVLTGASLQVRDISTNQEWQDAMHLAVPVLAVLDRQQGEVVLPRPPPRMPADRLQRHVEEAVAAAGVVADGADNGGDGPGSSAAGGGQSLPFTVVS